jgi:hypothetical protein
LAELGDQCGGLGNGPENLEHFVQIFVGKILAAFVFAKGSAVELVTVGFGIGFSDFAPSAKVEGFLAGGHGVHLPAGQLGRRFHGVILSAAAGHLPHGIRQRFDAI